MLNLVKSLTAGHKRALLVLVDSVLIPVALMVAFALQMSPQAAWAAMDRYLDVLPYLLAIAIGISLWLGVASVQLKSYEGSAIWDTALFAVLLASTSYLLCSMANIALRPMIHLLFGVYFFVFAVISRAILLQLVLAIYRMGGERCRVLIYGAGNTGMQLVSALRSHDGIEPVAFVDDNVALQGLHVARLPVHSPSRIEELVKNRNIDRVLIAMPSQSQPKLAQIARRLERMGLDVQTLPSFSQLIGEEALVDKLQPLHSNLFLNRDEVGDALGESAIAYMGRNVFISGAGGSIGSELSRQILGCRPARLVLFEMSEVGLYQIHQELGQLAEEAGVELVPVLGSVTEARQVRKVLSENDIQVVLHAAAYKHVPMVECNPIPGLANNVLGTQTLASESASLGIERFILISSDKAVRPTNVMGASKRLAELIVQDLASRVPQNEGPRFSIVRFGNVLGSSGSVVPLFQEQVRRGGPVTVTHPNVSRFFMTVQEAVSLVLCAGARAEGGEVYVLDMGKPVRIAHLARQVIESAGYTVRDSEHPEGDITIEYTGLRPGEKMTEELCLSGTLIGTAHKKIFKVKEANLSEIEVAAAMRGLRLALAAGDEDGARDVAARWVEGFDGSHVPPESVRSDTSKEIAAPVS